MGHGMDRMQLLVAAVLTLFLVSASAHGATLQSGDVVVVDLDSFGAPGGGAIFLVDTATGAQTVLSSGGSFFNPTQIANDASGDLLVTHQNPGQVFRVDPATGAQTLVASGGNLINPWGIAIDAVGDLLVTDFTSNLIVRVDPTSGAQTVVSSGGNFADPLGLAVGPTGYLFVAG